MAGLGAFPIGSTPFGSGTPVEATAPPVGTPNLANYVEPRTADYVVADDGSMQRMPIVRHQALMLLSTKRGSAAHEPGVGLELPAKIDQSFKQRAREAVLLALAPIGRDMRVDDVIVKLTGTGRADITIAYTDLTTGNSGTITI
jgi:hypothetical protein